MDQCMPGSTTLNLTQSNEISSFEVAIAVSKFPKSRVWSSSMEDIAYCDKLDQLSNSTTIRFDIPL
jgi:hypothetical protein